MAPPGTDTDHSDYPWNATVAPGAVGSLPTTDVARCRRWQSPVLMTVSQTMRPLTHPPAAIPRVTDAQKTATTTG